MNGVRLDFIRPGRPMENGMIESFNERLRDDCLNVHLFWTTEDAREKLEAWRQDYNQYRPYSALQDRTPAEVAAAWGNSLLRETESPGEDSCRLVEVPT